MPACACARGPDDSSGRQQDPSPCPAPPRRSSPDHGPSQRRRRGLHDGPTTPFLVSSGRAAQAPPACVSEFPTRSDGGRRNRAARSCWPLVMTGTGAVPGRSVGGHAVGGWERAAGLGGRPERRRRGKTRSVGDGSVYVLRIWCRVPGKRIRGLGTGRVPYSLFSQPLGLRRFSPHGPCHTELKPDGVSGWEETVHAMGADSRGLRGHRQTPKSLRGAGPPVALGLPPGWPASVHLPHRPASPGAPSVCRPGLLRRRDSRARLLGDCTDGSAATRCPSSAGSRPVPGHAA